MAFHSEVGSGSARATTNHDLLTKLVNFATSKYVATVVINAGGTGYAVGNILTLGHASAHLAARFEVTTVSGGVITGLRIVASGAYAQQATSATVSAGGTGYAVGNVLQVSGGSTRNPAKFSVATLSGSAVATVSLFESGGAYSSTPSNPAATTKVGPTAGSGSGCTLTVTYQAIIGTTGLSVTGGAGTGATVDITLAETGWSVDSRSVNNITFNSLTNERQVVLKGDASGRTNKPYFALCTGTSTSGINTRYFIALIGLIAHNPGLALASQPNVKGDPTTFGANNPYILCDENAAQSMDFWFSADDLHIAIIHNNNSGAANTDDGQYMHAYAGFLDTFATESENGYPFLLGASGRQQDIDPSASSQSISGAGECIAPASSQSGWWYYRVEDSTWQPIFNSQNLATNTEVINSMFPLGRLAAPDQAVAGTQPYFVATFSTVNIHNGIGSTGRTSATARLVPVPGTTPSYFPIPLTVLSRPGDSVISTTLDLPRGQLRGMYWIANSDSAGANITNFSEDYITIGSDRYRIFHNHIHTSPYQYIAIKENV